MVMNLKNLLPDRVRKTRTEAYRPFYSPQKEMNNLFDNFFQGFDLTPRGLSAGVAEIFSPSIDVKESDKEFIIKAELPGVDEKDIDVTVTDDSIAIRGEKKGEKEDKSENYYYMERSYGSFSRVIPLDAEIESDRVEATFKNGVLDIKIPKVQDARTKGTKVSIKTQ